MTAPDGAPEADLARDDSLAKSDDSGGDDSPAESRDESSGDDSPVESPNAEAARWRVQCREAESARDALTERLTGYQRREAEAAVADLLDEPADLFTIGLADLAEFYDDDGTLKADELRAAAGALCEQRPKLAKAPGPRHQNFGQYSPPPVMAPKVGWDQVLKG